MVWAYFKEENDKSNKISNGNIYIEGKKEEEDRKREGL